MKILETFTYQKPLQQDFSTLYLLLELPLLKAASVWKMEFALLVWCTQCGVWYVFPVKRNLLGNSPHCYSQPWGKTLFFGLWGGSGFSLPCFLVNMLVWGVSYTRRSNFFTFQTSHLSDPSYPTLKKLAGRRPDIPIYVGKTERPVFWNLNQSGVQLTNINVVPFGIWQQVRYQCFSHTFQLYFLGVNFW